MGGVFITHGQPVAAIAGLTVTPATATLSLAKNEAEQKSTLTVTNNYDVPVVLHFSFDTDQNATDRDKQAVSALAVTTPDATLGAGQTLTQTIVLSASSKLAPGSQQAEVVISQTAVSGTNVGVLPELRLPLILVKEDGAITSLGLTNIEQGILGLAIPNTVHTTLKNTGNMIAIPRGVITITAPNGAVVGQGTLNTASRALSPSASVDMSTHITRLQRATLPGPYRVHVRYGLGGDLGAQTVSATFVYIAWWHIVAVALVGAAIYYVVQHVLPAVQYRRLRRRPPPKHTALVGRNV
ncbi:MAG TPA: hypothetical protein VLE73_02975 [Candidatus Saccharimonadales bacterium]|nr:hypothetical protein [Candidatus Saccharimonadales bacterium]